MADNSEERRPLLGKPVYAMQRSRWRTQFACGAVLLTETFERIAFYGAVGNLVIFLNKNPLDWLSYNASDALFIFTGLSYMLALFGGWLADTYLGRFKTISIFFLVYIGGYVFFPLLNSEKHVPGWCRTNVTYNLTDMTDVSIYMWDEECAWAVILAIVITSLGIGAVKANIAPFGADQVKHEGPLMTRVFFNWFYWCVNIGALVSVGVVAYIQQEISFFWGFVVPNICLVIALVVFLIGRCAYITKPPGGSVISNIIKIIIEACRTCRRRESRLNDIHYSGAEISGIHEPPSCLDNAKIRYGGSFHDNMVDDVKTLGKVSCVFFALIPYWVVYFQMETTFLVQGLHMRLDFTPKPENYTQSESEFKLPAAWLSLFDIVFLIILIPIMDRLVYPKLDRSGYLLTTRCRIVIGMIFAILSVCCAGALEHYRMFSVYWKDGIAHTYNQTIGGTDYKAANMSILWQIPQYALIGVSEVFASVAELELAYTEAPRSMQGIVMGLFWFTQGLGSMFGTLTITEFQGTWFFNYDHGDINCRYKRKDDPSKYHYCHLDYYFFFLAGLQLLGILLFVAIAWKLKIGASVAPRHSNNRISKRTNLNIDQTSPPRAIRERIPSYLNGTIQQRDSASSSESSNNGM